MGRTMSAPWRSHDECPSALEASSWGHVR